MQDFTGYGSKTSKGIGRTEYFKRKEKGMKYIITCELKVFNKKNNSSIWFYVIL